MRHLGADAASLVEGRARSRKVLPLVQTIATVTVTAPLIWPRAHGEESTDLTGGVQAAAAARAESRGRNSLHSVRYRLTSSTDDGEARRESESVKQEEVPSAEMLQRRLGEAAIQWPLKPRRKALTLVGIL